MNKLFFALAIFALAAVHFHAHGAPETSAGPAAKPEQKPTAVRNPMRGNEPMSGEMKREGMMKDDVKKAAMKKEAMMQEAMKKEAMKQDAMSKDGMKK